MKPNIQDAASAIDRTLVELSGAITRFELAVAAELLGIADEVPPTYPRAIKELHEKLMWRGPTNKPLQQIMLPRDMAEELLRWLKAHPCSEEPILNISVGASESTTR